MQDAEPISDQASSQDIFTAFHEFVQVHQVLLNILIGKAGLFESTPMIGEPIAAVLRQEEAAIDVSLHIRKLGPILGC